MPTQKRLLKVFLCHASQDKPIVRELYQRLNAEGWIDSWLDEEKLLPGQDWDMEIEKAVEAADAVVVFLSSRSVSKEGYVQKEIRFALNLALFKPQETIFIVPLKLDECLVPRNLSSIQYIDYFPSERFDWAYQRLYQSLDLRLKQIVEREAVILESRSSTQELSQIEAGDQISDIDQVSTNQDSEANKQPQTDNELSTDIALDKPALSTKKLVKKKVDFVQPAKRRKRKRVDPKISSNENFEENVNSEHAMDLLYLAQVNLINGRLMMALENYNALAQKGVYLGIVVTSLEKIIEDYPDNALAWETLGYAYKGLKQNDKARHAFQKAK
jgi:tetratricopeptide (TPR) repeat protein